jgi:hypothetical protein
MTNDSLFHGTTRRRFLRDTTTLAVGLPALVSSAWARPGAEGKPASISNEFFEIDFDLETGRFSVIRNGEALLRSATARVVTTEGPIDSSHSAFLRKASVVVPVNDTLGNGQQLVVSCQDTRKRLDLEIRLSLYSGREAVLVEMVARNVSGDSLTLRSLQPIFATGEGGGSLHWTAVSKVLTNGPMYYDPGVVADFSSPDIKPLQSWWNVGFFRGYDQPGLVCGSVRNSTALGQLRIQPLGGGRISLTAESVLAPLFELKPGASVVSNPFMFQVASDPYRALEDYAQVLGELGHVRRPSILNGWCDWFYAFERITEQEVIANAEFAARHLKPFGFEYVQVDEGFQRWHGDWEGNAKFPHGMKWLADRIRALGLKPGIWLAPYVISEPTEVFKKHPEWMLREPDGTMKQVQSGYMGVRRFALDITHEGAAQWLFDLFDTVANKWGYELIKIDFVDWSLLSAERYHDPSVTRAQAYRKGIEIMRKAIGDKCHLLDCGPGPVSVGMLDSMRIELDQPPVSWNQYFLKSASSAPAAAKRYYFHKRAWVNDADHVCLTPLTVTEAQAAASLIALTGGNLISGDRLPDLDPVRLDILRKIFPSYGEAARPVDLFDTDRHSVFALKVRKAFGEWTVAGFFNISETEAVDHKFPLKRLWLDEDRSYLAYDFWKERFHGIVKETLSVRVPPASVVLLALHEARGVPQLISTDRHVLQGAHELEHVAWSDASNTLEGISTAPIGTAHNLSVYIPEPHPWFQGGPFLNHDSPGYTLRMAEEHILRIRVRFEESERVRWVVNVADFLKLR